MNDPLAIFLTIVLVEILLLGECAVGPHCAWHSQPKTVFGALFGVLGGRAIVWTLNRLALPQGLHAPFVMTGALVVFGLAEVAHGSGYLATYLAGLIVGNRPTRAHNTVVTFLDAVTWLAQIVMFTLLGLLVWPERLPQHALAALARGIGAHADCPPGRGVPLARPVPLFAAREAVRLLGGLARRRRHLPGVDSASGRPAQRPALFRRRRSSW